MKKVTKIFLIILSSFLLITGLIIGGFFIYLNTSKKGVQFDKKSLEAQNSTIDIYNINNEKLNKKTGKKALVKFEELPKYVPESFISIEDKNFYSHNGLNYKRMVKALLNNLKSHSLKEGASTISQQLIKNTHLSNKKTISRKINEMALTIQLEKNFTKNEILETYLNVIYFGSGAYGLENASELYFNKTASELSLSESATLAAIIKSPKTYSPIFNYDNAIKRRNLVLLEMKKDGKITKAQYDSASSSPIVLSEKIDNQKTKNYYEEATLLEAEKILNLSENEISLAGYKIFTYQDPIDSNALKSTILDKNYYEKNDYGNTADSAGVILDNASGGITAFDGKSIYDILSMKRSPGSSIKPILVYAPAIESGKISPSTMILDEKTNFNGYTPQNVGNKYYGWISAAESIEKSLNIPAIKILKINGIEKSKEMAKNCGIEFSNLDNNYAIALGGLTNGTSVIQLVNSYIPFSNGGNFIRAKFIRKICNKDGKTIYKNQITKNNVMSKETAYLMTDMLKASAKNGTSSRLHSLPFEVAGKTGTVGIKGTNYNSDVWSIGYTPEKTVGVWLGNSTGKKEFLLNGSNNGGTFCTSIVRDTLKNCNIDKSQVFTKPNGIIELPIDIPTLEKEHRICIADDQTPDRYKLTRIFNKKFAPTTYAEKFEKINTCTINTLLTGSHVSISFNAIKNAKYKLFRIEEDKRDLLIEFNNVSDKQIFVDKNTTPDTYYTYYIEVELDNQKIKSNCQKVYIPPSTASGIKKLISLW